VRLVALSTTFATNAIVEGRGEPVGLIVMPPYGRFDPARFRHSPVAAVRGRLEIDGAELEPVDLDEVRRTAADLVARHGVRAFAVAGYASHNNPSHELQVTAAIRAETGLGVTCGHEVSDGLNYRVRAETAALNARIIPLLEDLLADVRRVLDARGIAAPVMVVRSDGSLMSLDAARERPIETALSGPAASVAGAHRLTGLADALVVDMGGTTSDTARLAGGVVAVRREGARIGGWRTHVRALEMRTAGLGGDSLVRLEKGELSIGPTRVVPVCSLASREPRTAEAIAWLERRIDAFASSTDGMAILALSPGAAAAGADDGRGGRLLETLARRPYSLHELAPAVDAPSWRLLATGALEERGLVQRCSLTPTDLLHAAGRMALWDSGAARRLAALFAQLAGESLDAFVARGLARVERALAAELLRMQLEAGGTDPDGDRSPVAAALLDAALGARPTAGLSIAMRLEAPVVGIGAPVHQFLPAAAALLGTRAVVPEHADVANAIGAITGSVIVTREARITVDERGVYRVRGLPEAPAFEDLAAAEAFATERLAAVVAAAARRAGTAADSVEVTSADRVGTAADGSRVFLARTVTARVRGAPLG
jgi:N-methylhydantoinase A/oxoprolinase/acetone carboxylase beta subunit